MPKRSGIVLISVGLVLALLSAIVVVGIARQATAASQAQVRQVSVVVAKRDIPDQTQITADALEVKPFPIDFAPAGVYSTRDELVGRYAKGFLSQGQVIVAGQAQQAPQTHNFSERIPAGYVVIWLPQPALAAGVLKPGDHIDVLLTTSVSGSSDKSTTDKSSTEKSNSGGGMSTQTTLQNIEIYRIGDDELGLPPSSPAVETQSSFGSSSSSQPKAQSTNQQSIGLLVDHQNAVIMKFIKDSGGTIDLVSRSADDAQLVHTDGVTLDALTDQFNFRIPSSKTTGGV